MRGRDFSVLGGLVVLATLAGGCASSQVTAADTRDAQVLAAMPDTPDALIQMRRGGCAPNHCPIYGLSIFTDGTVAYDGRANVTVTGHRRAKLAPDRLNELVAAIEGMDFLDTSAQCCVCQTDLETHMVILDYRPGSVQKTVVHDEACFSAPAAMRALEQQIDKVTNVTQWTAPASVAKASAPMAAAPAPVAVVAPAVAVTPASDAEPAAGAPATTALIDAARSTAGPPTEP
jgi:hypothetical protein